jgi:hypothetical protein
LISKRKLEKKKSCIVLETTKRKPWACKNKGQYKMLKAHVTKIVLPLVLAGACGAANAGVLTFQGVTFTSTASGNTLTLEIDAAHPTGDWATATTIGALELKNVGDFTSVQLLSAPGAAINWKYSSNELTAKGCAGGSQDGSFACFWGRHVALTDDMVFRFEFAGTAFDLDEPTLKVNFFAGNSARKVGSLLSQTIPAGEVTPPPTELPEPASAAMFLGGLALMRLAQRRKDRR